MHVLRRGRHDPWWDLDGSGAKRSRRKRTFVGNLAFALAIVACGLTAAAWALEAIPHIGPLLERLGPG